MACPWQSFGDTGYLDRVCEANLCAWVVEPGNTVSNVGYLLVAARILWRQPPGTRARWFGYAAIVIGIASSFYHASNLSWARFADYFSIYLITGTMTAVNIDRWVGLRRSAQRATALILPLVLLGGVIIEPSAAFWILVLGMPCCAIECRLIARDWQRVNFRQFWIAWAYAGAAIIGWWADAKPSVCHPHWHGLSGHTAWHLLSAMFLLHMAAFYRQFDADRGLSQHRASISR